MSRNFGISGRAPRRREKLLSDRAEDILLFILCVVFLVGIWLIDVELPRGALSAAFVAGR